LQEYGTVAGAGGKVEVDYVNDVGVRGALELVAGFALEVAASDGGGGDAFFDVGFVHKGVADYVDA
jgi:hypothetical protein